MIDGALFQDEINHKKIMSVPTIHLNGKEFGQGRMDIDEIINNLEKNKIVNDELYSDSKARMFLRRGYSLNKINQSLRHKGIDSKYIKQSIDKIKEDQIEPDFVSALKLCKRRRIGPLRPDANRELFYKKDMGILARGGFSFDLSKRVLNTHQTDSIKLKSIVR